MEQEIIVEKEWVIEDFGEELVTHLMERSKDSTQDGYFVLSEPKIFHINTEPVVEVKYVPAHTRMLLDPKALKKRELKRNRRLENNILTLHLTKK